MAVEEGATPPKKKKPRSPSYPGIPLGDAIQRARVIYDKENRHTVPQMAILEDLGYSQRSGAGSVVIAALRKYGLLVYEGKNARLSELALKIIWDEDGSEDGRAAIREAALSPTIHAELWAQYGGHLPSDSALRMELRKRGFAETAIPDVIRILRSTVDFAGLSAADKVPDKEGTPSSEPPNPQVVPLSQASTIQRSAPNAPPPIQLPLLGGTVVTLQASGPVSEQAWEQMMSVFRTLKPGFVTPAEGSAGSAAESE